MTDPQNNLPSDSTGLSAPRDQPQSISAQLMHDLRTPLDQIIGYSELLGEQAQEENRSGLAEDVGKIRGAGKHLLSLVETNFLVREVPSSSPSALKVGRNADSDADAVLQNRDVPDAIESGDSTSGHILIVDDNESNRDVLARRLDKQGYHFEMAQSGQEALGKVRARAFDVVLLDIMMPEMDGYEVLKRMKADEVLRRIPVIMISALGEMDSVVRCIEMGAEDYLPKPFSPTLLRARISACLEKKRAHDREAHLLAEAQKNYEQLRRTERQRDDLMHMVIHDLRSPLSSNLSGIEMVEMAGPLSEQQRDCLEIALRSGHNLLDLINDLLDIAKMESGELGLELQPCDASQIATAAMDQVIPLVADKKLQLTRDIAPGLSAVLADESKLRRVFVNLLSNAVKFTPHAGSITFAAREVEGFVQFSVQDTGEGIPEASLTHIFEKYHQVESRKGGRKNSTGLGLTYCKLAVEAHGGRIWVESTPGIGSTFFFTIPLA